VTVVSLNTERFRSSVLRAGFRARWLGLLLLLSGPVPAVAQDVRERPLAAVAAGAGFLAPADLPDASLILPAPPEPGDPRAQGDMEVFRSTRQLMGSARWSMAIRDDSYRPEDMMEAFSCPLGIRLTPVDAPRLAEVLARAAQDAGLAAVKAKDLYRRPRPFVSEKGPVCIPISDGLRASFDYPSGHAALGWIQGLVLAQLAPDRAGGVLARARAFGDSRVVCGLHTPTAVEAGRLNASAVFATLQASVDFQRGLRLAGEELARLRERSAPPDAGRCEAEAVLSGPLSYQPG